MAEVTHAFASLVLAGAAAAAAAQPTESPTMKTYAMLAEMRADSAIRDFRELARIAGDPLDKAGCSSYEATLGRTEELRSLMGRIAPELQQLYDEKLTAKDGDTARKAAVTALEQRGCKIPTRAETPAAGK